MWQIKVTHTKKKHTGVDMKNKLAKDGKRLTSYVGKNAEPSCSTWHQAAPMYLPSTSYTGESIKSEVADGELAEGA